MELSRVEELVNRAKFFIKAFNYNVIDALLEAEKELKGERHNVNRF